MATALVTGGTSGIGAAFARQLARRGHDLVLVARDAARLEEVAADLRGSGVQVEVLRADLADRVDVQRVADRLEDAGRPVDLLVNNAGFGLASRLLDPDTSEQERALDVMAKAVLVLGGAAGRGMRARGRGAVLNVSSVAGFVTMGGYSAVKAWVTAYSESLAGELAGSGVTVTALCPGFVRTEFHERADLHMSKLPELGWVDVEELVSTALDDVARGRVISVPTARYAALVHLIRHAPRSLVRRGSRAVVSARS
ncbi:SDR family oxidoreductase [uncultured Pseudokineococcus sp.]|uniref:SDR family NAD(P)-dependent oxidoreductase n=1 Tax=uncultured Pseudokineococcus sp. TaxID=1642928 RepID=UPI00262E2271|nr:SDR family NAD(P)-dependent oxidoreductase [uncultured Pseudokineococcus sp.]